MSNGQQQAMASAEATWQAHGGADTAFEAGWAAALAWAAPALKRHLQWFVKDGVKICGGCLCDWPCPDAGLLHQGDCCDLHSRVSCAPPSELCCKQCPEALRQEGGTCCDLHGRNCEPPSELCCENCTELDHPDHTQLRPCSNPDLS